MIVLKHRWQTIIRTTNRTTIYRWTNWPTHNNNCISQARLLRLGFGSDMMPPLSKQAVVCTTGDTWHGSFLAAPCFRCIRLPKTVCCCTLSLAWNLDVSWSGELPAFLCVQCLCVPHALFDWLFDDSISGVHAAFIFLISMLSLILAWQPKK